MENNSYTDVTTDVDTDTTSGDGDPSAESTREAAAEYTETTQPNSNSGSDRSEQKEGTPSAAAVALQLATMVVSDQAAYNAGLVQGFFVDGLWGDVTGIWGAITGAVSGIGYLGRITSDFYLGTHLFSDEEAIALDRRLSAVEDFGAALKSRGSEIVQAMLSGNTGKLSGFGGQIFSAAGGLIVAVASAVAQNVSDPKTQGRIMGWVLAQVAVALATAGAANAIKAGKLASIASKLDDVAFLADNPKLLLALKTAFSKVEAIAGHRLPTSPADVGPTAANAAEAAEAAARERSD